MIKRAYKPRSASAPPPTTFSWRDECALHAHHSWTPLPLPTFHVAPGCTLIVDKVLVLRDGCIVSPGLTGLRAQAWGEKGEGSGLGKTPAFVLYSALGLYSRPLKCSPRNHIREMCVATGATLLAAPAGTSTGWAVHPGRTVPRMMSASIRQSRARRTTRWPPPQCPGHCSASLADAWGEGRGGPEGVQE